MTFPGGSAGGSVPHGSNSNDRTSSQGRPSYLRFSEREALRDANASQAEIIERLGRLRAENDRYRRALVEIMHEDYRGPMPTSVRIAGEALREDRPE